MEEKPQKLNITKISSLPNWVLMKSAKEATLAGHHTDEKPLDQIDQTLSISQQLQDPFSHLWLLTPH